MFVVKFSLFKLSWAPARDLNKTSGPLSSGTVNHWAGPPLPHNRQPLLSGLVWYKCVHINVISMFFTRNVFTRRRRLCSDGREQKRLLPVVFGDRGTGLQWRRQRGLRWPHVAGPLGFAPAAVAGRRRDVPPGVRKHHRPIRTGNKGAAIAFHVGGPENRKRLRVHKVSEHYYTYKNDKNQWSAISTVWYFCFSISSTYYVVHVTIDNV